ncbi:ParB/RepB/Spo0J family partition protein [Schaalia sp. lx-100]|uniref:ParB/RepB/Spo0J family partition protein n=1 Tax=Schaalia sp. lx-100 TaxID=2899081 RepID=UPI001E2ED91F|nr:ParB/RepB/Spo0J family partition protein [Schaalia sp. lx-100]MCD4558239.1 ParB/RepB/Spo0J family partition protein [Schaalia sp. lx-100]
MTHDLTTSKVPTESLNLYYKNPRLGNVTKIAESLQRNGQYRAIVVNKGTHTGRHMEVLAGNHTLKAARQIGMETITAHIIDVDEDQATRIVLADNKTADLGTYDNELITQLIDTLNEDYEGTGYTEQDLDELTGNTDPEDSGIEDTYTERFELVVECQSETHQEALFTRLTNEGEKCRLLTL